MHSMKRVRALLAILILAFVAQLAMLFTSAPLAYASGEKYEWKDGLTIIASGGVYTSPVTFTGKKTSYGTFLFSSGSAAGSTSSNSKCNQQFSIEIGTTTADASASTSGSVSINKDIYGCQASDIGLDTKITIAPAGSTAPSTGTTDDAEKKKCEEAKNVWDPEKKTCVDSKTACEANGGKWNDNDKNCEGPKGKTNCSPDIGAVGWIICPVMSFMSSLNDKMFEIISALLAFPGSTLNTSGNSANAATYKAWSMFRNYANIAFIVVFMIIIFSQVSNIGINNYGIKRMLPRLLIGAVLVNISFYVCAAMVDVSNIIGAGIKDLFDGLGAAFGEKQSWSSVTAKILAGTGLGAAVVGAVVVGVLTQGGLGFIALLAPIVLAALLAFGMILLILVARWAFIVLLIVVSPLAFVAYLLPNTEQWFKRWWKMFSTLLFLYPVVAIVFGASGLASAILVAMGGWWIVVGLGVQAIPLFAVPTLLKGSLAATGAIGAKMQGLGNKATGYAGKTARNQAKNSSLATGVREAWGYRQSNRKNAQAQRRATGPLRGAFGRVGGERYGARMINQANSVEQKEYEDSVKMADDAALHSNMSYQDRMAAARTGTHNGVALTAAERDAHIRFAMGAGNFRERSEVLSTMGGMTDSQRRSAASGARAKGDHQVWGSTALGRMEANDPTIGDTGEFMLGEAQSRMAAGAIGGDIASRDAHTASMLSEIGQGQLNGTRGADGTPTTIASGTAVPTENLNDMRANVDRHLASANGGSVSQEVRNSLEGGRIATHTTAQAEAPAQPEAPAQEGGEFNI